MESKKEEETPKDKGEEKIEREEEDSDVPLVAHKEIPTQKDDKGKGIMQELVAAKNVFCTPSKLPRKELIILR